MSTLRTKKGGTEKGGTDLDARYGRTRSSRRRTRIVVIAAALAFALVFSLWLVWGGLLGAPAQLQSNDTGYVVTDEGNVTVSWALTVPPGTPTKCAVQALNSTFGIVGWKIVDVPASAQLNRDLTESVRTTERAVTGLIYRCWLT